MQPKLSGFIDKNAT